MPTHKGVDIVNKTDLVNEVAAKTGMTKKDVDKIVNAFFSSVEDALKSGDKVQLIGFGTFEVRDRQERKGRNPQTGEEITIAATKVPAFKAGKALKEAVV
ncbi:MAG TPA: HU family DNA-binding protein [Syntrophomonadaceae bacterium]|nr:HU family DNA-binding protein [Syntrophomonadaceae bacterium]